MADRRRGNAASVGWVAEDKPRADHEASLAWSRRLNACGRGKPDAMLVRSHRPRGAVPPVVANPQTDTIIFGLDSAWSDKNPGAICGLAFDQTGEATFHTPTPVRFADALDYIRVRRQSHACMIVAIDQPTIVPNETGMRPVERVAGALLGRTGGGVQPANRQKKDMFGDGAPIWQFEDELGAENDAERARCADRGAYLIEVFPALALSGLADGFANPGGAPKYNPRNSKFCQQDWIAVVDETAKLANSLDLPGAGSWCSKQPTNGKPTKGDQDCLDAAICALVGFIWRACAPSASAVIGDTVNGYMVTPVSAATHKTLKNASRKEGVRFA